MCFGFAVFNPTLDLENAHGQNREAEMLGTTFVVAKEHALLAECRLLLVGKFVCSLDCIHLTWCWGLCMVCLDHNSPQCKRIRGTLAISQLDNEVLSCTSF
jgi:hypothetical protein